MASVYVQSGGFNPLWNEIMNVHWKFLDADESMEKIELRNQLEALILQYLCNWPHSEKFFHVETVQVLKSSIAKMNDFSAYKASLGFDAISQYANNLFTKPWRKEYKTVKMYSGFYQHEIAANLVGAEVLFEHMGYRVMPNQTLVFEGAICPDRVTNVSRDAITANVECLIMKEIYNQLTELSLPVDWSDIFSFRENNTMDVSQSVQQMAALIKEKLQKNQQPRREAVDSYGTLKAPAVGSCNSCSAYQFHPHMQHHQQQQQQQSSLPPPSMVMHPALPPVMPFYTPQSMYSATPCSLHNQPSNLAYGYHDQNSYTNYLPTSPSQAHVHSLNQSNVLPSQAPPSLGAIPHSKSLDHYQDPSMYNLTTCMQRHSIDQPFEYAAASSASHYGGPMGVAPPTGAYDTVDSCSMAYSNHPYNVSGNRIPLPLNLSANIGPCINGIPGKPGFGESYFHHPSINNYTPMPPYYHHCNSSNGQLYGQQPQSQRHVPGIYINHNFENTGTQTPPSILSKKKNSYDDYDVPSVRHSNENKHPDELIYIDTREENKKDRKKIDRNVKTTDLLGDYECDMLPESLVERHQHQQQPHHRHHHLHHQMSRNSRQSDFDSYEDEKLQAGAYQRASNVNRRISSKNQDGIGSYESWNYVFQNLEKQGYSKDLGERGDFLVSAEGDEIPEGNTSRGSTLKRSSNDKLKAMKVKSADRMDGIRVASTRQSTSGATKHDRENERNEMVARAGQKPSLVQKLSKPISNNQADNSHKANHTNNVNSTNNNEASGSRRNSITRKISSSTKETVTSTTNATNSSSTSTGGGILINHNSSNYHGTSAVLGRKKTTSFDTAAATIINPVDDRDRSRNSNNGGTKISEWNCKFCTYLNPVSERICEMCAKSRDSNLNSSGAKVTAAATSNGTATCV